MSIVSHSKLTLVTSDGYAITKSGIFIIPGCVFVYPYFNHYIIVSITDEGTFVNFHSTPDVDPVLILHDEEQVHISNAYSYFKFIILSDSEKIRYMLFVDGGGIKRVIYPDIDKNYKSRLQPIIENNIINRINYVDMSCVNGKKFIGETVIDRYNNDCHWSGNCLTLEHESISFDSEIKEVLVLSAACYISDIAIHSNIMRILLVLIDNKITVMICYKNGSKKSYQLEGYWITAPIMLGKTTYIVDTSGIMRDIRCVWVDWQYLHTLDENLKVRRGVVFSGVLNSTNPSRIEIEGIENSHLMNNKDSRIGCLHGLRVCNTATKRMKRCVD